MPFSRDEPLMSLKLGAGLRDALAQGYGKRDIVSDLIAGITVGVVAVPLAMALAIASGVQPEYGLYTAIIAGIVTALTGGTRLSVSGPTAAFVVILYPISHTYGVGGLLTATFMAGIILLLMGLARMGRFIQFIPGAVTTGFTTGIATVIVVMQIKDFFGLNTGDLPGNFLDRVMVMISHFNTVSLGDTLVGIITLILLLVWPKLKIKLPAHLFAITLGAVVAFLLQHVWPSLDIATINSRFTYQLGGEVMPGIPNVLPSFMWPWEQPDAFGNPQGLNFALIQALMGPALAIAVLGAIESLLCSVVVDGMSGTKHNANAELVGQGLGNIVAPFFGGITSTGAIARTATNFKAGGKSPLSSVVHSLLILTVILYLAEYLGYIPMASLAALLFVTAWNMSDVPHAKHLIEVAPRGDRMVLLTCFLLTVFFDMVVAVGVGVALAAALFMRNMAEMTEVRLLGSDNPRVNQELPDGVKLYKLSGPLFFAAAERAMRSLNIIEKDVHTVILYMDAVPIIDVSGIAQLEATLRNYHQRGIRVLFADLQKQPRKALRRAGIKNIEGEIEIYGTLTGALKRIRLEAEEAVVGEEDLDRVDS